MTAPRFEFADRDKLRPAIKLYIRICPITNWWTEAGSATATLAFVDPDNADEPLRQTTVLFQRPRLNMNALATARSEKASMIAQNTP